VLLQKLRGMGGVRGESRSGMQGAKGGEDRGGGVGSWREMTKEMVMRMLEEEVVVVEEEEAVQGSYAWSIAQPTQPPVELRLQVQIRADKVLITGRPHVCFEDSSRLARLGFRREEGRSERARERGDEGEAQVEATLQRIEAASGGAGHSVSRGGGGGGGEGGEGGMCVWVHSVSRLSSSLGLPVDSILDERAVLAGTNSQ
jgi:hypothetical protein